MSGKVNINTCGHSVQWRSNDPCKSAKSVRDQLVIIELRFEWTVPAMICLPLRELHWSKWGLEGDESLRRRPKSKSPAASSTHSRYHYTNPRGSARGGGGHEWNTLHSYVRRDRVFVFVYIKGGIYKNNMSVRQLYVLNSNSLCPSILDSVLRGENCFKN